MTNTNPSLIDKSGGFAHMNIKKRRMLGLLTVQVLAKSGKNGNG